jgi:hypothetical protein
LSRSFLLVWIAIVVGAVLAACTGDLELPQPAKQRSTGAIRPRLPSREESAAALLSRVRLIIGMQPAECGQHFLTRTSDTVVAIGRSELELSLKCGMAAARAKQPFWTFKQEQGIDSWIAQGLLGGPDGLIQHFWYDSAPCGGSGCEPRLTISPCARPSVSSVDGQARFSCIGGRS